MDKSTHEVRIAHWKAIVTQCQGRPQGQSAASWLAENGVDNKQYYYWLRQIRRETFEEMKGKALPSATDSGNVTFAEIPVLSNSNAQPPMDMSGFHPDVVVRYKQATVAVSNSASAELLTRIIEAVNHAG